MNNIMVGVKRFFKNKNTVTIFAVVVCFCCCRSLLLCRRRAFAVKCPLLNLLIKPILNGIIKAFYLFDRREL